MRHIKKSAYAQKYVLLFEKNIIGFMIVNEHYQATEKYGHFSQTFGYTKGII